MKKLSILLGSALVMLTAGCSKDATKDVAPSDKVTVFEMNIEGDADARTVLDGHDVLWSEGDCVAINGTKATVADEYVGKNNAQFAVEGVGNAPYRVIYPAEAYNTDGTITVSEIQEYAPNSFAQGAAVMAGYGETTSISLKNLYGLVKITILKEGDERIQSVTLHSNNLEAMTGTFTVDYTTDFALTPLAGMDFVKVVSSTGIDYDDDGKAVIYIAVPAGKYGKGFTVKVATDKGTMSRSANKGGATIERNTIYSMPELAYKKNETSAVESITNATQLQAFLDAVNAGDYSAYKAGNGEVQLGDDIDLDGKTITPAASFDGVFNGRGYKLKNWQADGTALFNKLTEGGIIKNVILDESCVLKFPNETTGAFGFLVCINLGCVSGCSNYANAIGEGTFKATAQTGIIVGSTQKSAAITQNCVNFGSMTITKTGNNAGTNNIGTVSGHASNGATINHCINYGNIVISITDDTTTNNMYIGGVTGSSNSTTTTINCINHGNILYHLCKAQVTTEAGDSGETTATVRGAAVCMGGITSYSAGEINGCENYGDITIQSDSDTNDKNGVIKGTAIGGITGYQNSAIQNCINKGNLTIECGIFGGRNAIGGINNNSSSPTASSSAAPAIGGIVAYGYSSNNATFSITNCINYGKIKYCQTNCDSAANSYAGRHAFGGIVAAPWGNITNCDNYGDMDLQLLTSDKKAVAQSVMPIVGGIAGGDYYPLTQNETNINHCTNEGNINVTHYGSKANSAIGGIVGWPGQETTSLTIITKDCVNKGNITVGGLGKARVGGIQGGSGNIDECTNYGKITLNNSTTSAIGGVAGFHSQNHHIYNSNNYGDIVATAKTTQGVGGYIGNAGNAANTNYGGIVKCNVSAPDGSYAGLVVGFFNGTTKQIVIGTSDNPLHIKGQTKIGTTTKIVTSKDDITKKNIFGGVKNAEVDAIKCDITNIVILEE